MLHVHVHVHVHVLLEGSSRAHQGSSRFVRGAPTSRSIFALRWGVAGGRALPQTSRIVRIDETASELAPISTSHARGFGGGKLSREESTPSAASK